MSAAHVLERIGRAPCLVSVPAPDSRCAAAPRPSPAELAMWLAAALDELDYGIVVLHGGMRAVYANDAAVVELEGLHPLQVLSGELCACSGRDIAPLRKAIEDAESFGLRRFLTVGADTNGRASVSIVPLEGAVPGASRAVLVVLAKRTVCETLSIHGFARSHGLTAAETRVLESLCGGTPPAQAASELGVAISTVRSQIGSIRAKTGAHSIRALVKQVAVLPPVKGALRRRNDLSVTAECAGPIPALAVA